MDKQRVLERIQTLGDMIDERYDQTTVHNAKKLDILIEEAYELVTRRKKNRLEKPNK